jgi:precorrin-3B synthase
MNAPIALREGWCPGALAPMRTGDGLLVRLRVSGRPLSLDRVEAIADCAARYGNGVIELSSRANIQLRGVREATLPDLQRRLSALGLIDANAADEAARNIVASPIADIDPGAILDVSPIVVALEARIAVHPSLRRLPAKFGFLIDGGGALPLGDVEADVRFEAFRDEDGARFAVALAGDDDAVAVCAPREIPGVAASLAAAFLREAVARGDSLRRMRELTLAHGAAPVLGAAGLRPARLPASPRRAARQRDFIGTHPLGDSFFVGAAPVLGRMTAEDFLFLALEARRCLAADIRVTPLRALIVSGLQRRGAQDLAAALAPRFIVDPADPRLAVVACAGAPACAKAARRVQAEALAFASALASGAAIALHVSGCAKGCAHPRAAPFTLVARPSGYDLVVNGRAGDEPLRVALPPSEIAPLLARLQGKPWP